MKESSNITNPLLLQALAYASRRNWHVFPCRAGDKRPATRRGFKDATTDKTQVIAWWRENPGANVGVATGAVSGLVVLDIDPRNGGDASLRELEERHGRLPDTPQVLTGGDGRHFFFMAPKGTSVASRKVADGIDLKADGGYVIAPPSQHPSGGTYRWAPGASGKALAPCPPWLLAREVHPPDAGASRLGQAFERLGMLGKRLDEGKRTVVCPWEAEHSTGKSHDSSTVLFPPSTPGGLGGFHCSHSHCDGRSAADAQRALLACEATPSQSAPWMSHLRRTDKGEPRATFGNIVLLLGSDSNYAGKLRRDEMRGVISLGPEEVTDATISEIRVDLEKRFGMTPRDAETAKAVEFVASRNGYHPVRDFLASLAWDGKRRLDSVAREILRASPETDEEAALLALLVRRWFLSIVARPFEPGCKVDTALILQGAQGIGKSSFFREIARDWFSDTEMALDKDAMMQLRGAWLYEWAELENVTRRHEESRVKAFLTSREDKYRPPFGRAPVTVKRSGVIVGTTNREDFLHDPTGSRRFWVVPVGIIDLERLRAERDQLLAETVAAYRTREPWWLTEAEEEQRAELAARFADVDPWESDVLAYAERQETVRTRDVLLNVLQFSLDKIDRRADMRVASILRRNGYTPHQARLAGQKGRFWCRSQR